VTRALEWLRASPWRIAAAVVLGLTVVAVAVWGVTGLIGALAAGLALFAGRRPKPAPLPEVLYPGDERQTADDLRVVDAHLDERADVLEAQEAEVRDDVDDMSAAEVSARINEIARKRKAKQ